MRVLAATEPGSPTRPNEDRVFADDQRIVVVDGATARTDTGCVHGVAWYAGQLTKTLLVQPGTDLRADLAEAIRHVASLHEDCDLRHPGTPSAAVGLVTVSEDVLRYLVLADVFVVIDRLAQLDVIVDERVTRTAAAERHTAYRLPVGSAERTAALVEMKRAELAVRNQAEGFWVATSDPAVAEYAIVGEVPLADVRKLAVLSDGAACGIVDYGLLDWPSALDLMTTNGPHELLRLVRATEADDQECIRWPRSKVNDDASVAFWDLRSP
jgi:hypothetical protein